MKIHFKAHIVSDEKIELILDKKKIYLIKNKYSDWIELKFKAGLGIKVHGIVRFYLLETRPHLRLYMTPINIDPEKPALPISHPYYYSVYLAKLFGKYTTLGLAEDTSALNEGILDEKAFLEQVYLIHQEHENHFFHALEKTKKGLCAIVIDATDRIQHMFFRTLDQDHPANKGKDIKNYKHTIEDLYIRMDDLVGRTMKKLRHDDVFIVLSDHGFKSFRRGVNLNSWLKAEGYLSLKDGKYESKAYYQNVNWARTKAYAFGLAGIYINLKGREKNGIVEPGEEYTKLKKEIITKLTDLEDPQDDKIAVTKVFDNKDIFSGPYIENGPDLICGYNIGYRISWGGAKGIVNSQIFEDNIRSWSGDHCIDSQLVPGVLFCNIKIKMKAPALIDIAPTVLDLFGIKKPSYIEGYSIFADDINTTSSDYSNLTDYKSAIEAEVSQD